MTKAAVTPEQVAGVTARRGASSKAGPQLEHGIYGRTGISRVVIVARDEAMRGAMCEEVRAAGFDCLAFEQTETARFGPTDRVRCAVLVLNGQDSAARADAVHALLQSEPHLPVVIVGESDGTHAVRAAMRAGARDYLTQPLRTGELAESIRYQIHRTIRWCSPSNLLPGFARLSRCECCVLDGVIRGCSTKQIAAELGRVEKTIEYHRKRIMEKLGVGTAVQLVRLVTLHNWTLEGHAEVTGSSRSARRQDGSDQP